MDMDNPEYFLGEGSFTGKTDFVDELVSGMDGDILPLASKLVDGLPGIKKKSTRRKYFRRRTGADIIKSGCVAGCTDSALAFIVLARAGGIPTKYVETFDRGWISGDIRSDSRPIQGHIFTDVFVDGLWRPYEPRRGVLSGDDYALSGISFEVAGKGLDFGGVHLLGKDGYSSDTECLQTVRQIFSAAEKLKACLD